MSVAKLKPQTRQLYLLQGGGGVAHVLPGMVETQLSATSVFDFRHCPVVQGRKIKMSLFLLPVLWCCGVARCIQKPSEQRERERERERESLPEALGRGSGARGWGAKIMK